MLELILFYMRAEKREETFTQVSSSNIAQTKKKNPHVQLIIISYNEFYSRHDSRCKRFLRTTSNYFKKLHNQYQFLNHLLLLRASNPYKSTDM